MIQTTGFIYINIEEFAIYTVEFMAIRASFGTLFYFFAELTTHFDVNRVYLDEFMSAWTLSINVSYYRPRFRLVKMLRQLGVTALA